MENNNKGLLHCKIVVVGDSQCGKTALLHVFAKDSYPESYVPTVFENYTASFEIDKQRIELNMWDTSGSTYYDNVRPLAYPDSDAVLICFDISRPETLESVLKKWLAETQEFCPNAKVVLVGCKLDMRTDLNVMRELSKHRLIPVTHEQVSERPSCMKLTVKFNQGSLSPALTSKSLKGNLKTSLQSLISKLLFIPTFLHKHRYRGCSALGLLFKLHQKCFMLVQQKAIDV
uniref:Rho-related GTP-binding protein RhoN n=1 Tax=Oryzias sinensis TaxID=183150 RepID=A0A8C8DPU0_9TELE